MSGSEVERIRAAYRARDAVAAGTSSWADRGYRLRLQELEWGLLEGLRRTGIDPHGASVLEVGCGGGYFLSRFLDYGAAHAAGIDLMEERIALAGERYPRLELVAGDASRLPWDGGSFDLVTQFTCLSSILDPALRVSIAGEMWRVLRPGGAIVSYDVSGIPVAARALRRAAAWRHGATLPGTAITPVTRDELGRLLPGASLDLRRVTLSTDIASLVERNAPLLRLLGSLPLLRTHLLAVGRKPG